MGPNPKQIFHSNLEGRKTIVQLVSFTFLKIACSMGSGRNSGPTQSLSPNTTKHYILNQNFLKIATVG